MKLHRRAFGAGAATALAGLAFLFIVSSPATAAPRTGARQTALPVVTGAKMPGDFNYDAKPDLLFQHGPSGRLAVWMMDGTKPMDRVSVNPSGSGDASLVVVGTDDFDGDFNSDILFYRANDGTLAVWHMDGLDLIYKTQLEDTFKGYEPVSVLDFDRDGNSDILFQHRNDSGDLFVLLLSGTKAVGKVPLTLPSAGEFLDWRVVGTADFDRDGDADLVLHRHARAIETIGAWADVVAIAFMDGTAGALTEVSQVGNRNWVLRSVADWSADGWPDLMWENTLTDDVGVWEMKGTEILSQYVVSSPSMLEKGWHVVAPR